MKTGEIIKMCRERKNMTQDELARLVNFSDKSSISKIETGKRDVTRVKLVQIAEALGVSPLYLMGRDPDNIAEAYAKADPYTQAEVRRLLGVE